MIDIKSLLPEVQKLLPGVNSQEILQGIQQFIKVHPTATNQQVLQALMTYLQQQKPQTPSQPPFQGLMNTLGAH